MKIKVNNKEYTVEVARTEEEKQKGLQNIENLPENEGMLFEYDEPQHVDFWMKDTKIPLDIVFINEDQSVISVSKGKPMDESYISEDDVMYVLEVNQDSGIKKGDDLEFDEDEEYVMKVLAPDGSAQMLLKGGERIFSRKNSIMLIKWAKKSYTSKNDADYKHLGKLCFKYLKIQDGNTPEYVELKN